jgi:hypothetical protein
LSRHFLTFDGDSLVRRECFLAIVLQRFEQTLATGRANIPFGIGPFGQPSFVFVFRLPEDLLGVFGVFSLSLGLGVVLIGRVVRLVLFVGEVVYVLGRGLLGAGILGLIVYVVLWALLVLAILVFGVLTGGEP